MITEQQKSAGLVVLFLITALFHFVWFFQLRKLNQQNHQNFAQQSDRPGQANEMPVNSWPKFKKSDLSQKSMLPEPDYGQEIVDILAGKQPAKVRPIIWIEWDVLAASLTSSKLKFYCPWFIHSELVVINAISSKQWRSCLASSSLKKKKGVSHHFYYWSSDKIAVISKKAWKNIHSSNQTLAEGVRAKIISIVWPGESLLLLLENTANKVAINDKALLKPYKTDWVFASSHLKNPGWSAKKWISLPVNRVEKLKLSTILDTRLALAVKKKKGINFLHKNPWLASIGIYEYEITQN